MSTPGMYSFLCKSTETSNKKLFSQVTFLRKVILFGVKHYIRVPNFFFIIWVYGYQIRIRISYIQGAS
jgi:hypothetical protein